MTTPGQREGGPHSAVIRITATLCQAVPRAECTEPGAHTAPWGRCYNSYLSVEEAEELRSMHPHEDLPPPHLRYTPTHVHTYAHTRNFPEVCGKTGLKTSSWLQGSILVPQPLHLSGTPREGESPRGWAARAGRVRSRKGWRNPCACAEPREKALSGCTAESRDHQSDVGLLCSDSHALTPF